MRSGILQLAIVALLLPLCAAAEIHSNGLGGGRWSDPASWHGNAVPTKDDAVVIATGDTIAFDGNDIEQPSCAQVSIDPEGVLTFRADAASHVLSVAGPIESYGAIRMDGTRSPQGSMELRLAGADDAGRTIRLLRNASLLAYGAEGLPDERRNVLLSTLEPAAGQPRRLGTVVAGVDTMIDLHSARLTDIAVQASSIDNTGFKPNERLNIVGNRFAGLSQLSLNSCDTPLVNGNVFDCGEGVTVPIAITTASCKLADIRANHIVTGYQRGIQVQSDEDSSCTGNTVTAAEICVYWHGTNAMVKNNTISGAATGVQFTSASGVAEGLGVAGAKTAIEVINSSFQLTDVHVENLPEDGVALSLNNAAVTLLNSNLAPEKIKGVGAPPGAEPWVQAMEYLVVRVKGERPAGTEVEVRTAAASGGPPQGAADLNVRNSPASLSTAGFTPLPASLRPLIVRSWSLKRDGKKGESPFYDLVTSAPAAAEGEAPKVLKTQVIEPKPEWYRPDPNAPVPTLEVALP